MKIRRDGFLIGEAGVSKAGPEDSQIGLMIREIIEELNKKGKPARPKEIQEELERRGVKYQYKKLVGLLTKMAERNELIKYKKGKRGTVTYYALPEYSYVLWKHVEFKFPDNLKKHFESIVKGLEVLSKTYELVVPEEDARRAYYALQHIFRGERFRHLGDLLNKGEIYEFERETGKMVDELRELSPNYVSSMSADEFFKYYGSCEICGAKPRNGEKDKLREWWEKLRQRKPLPPFPG